VRLLTSSALALLLLSQARLSALDVEVKRVRLANGTVTAAIEVRDVIPERFRKTVDEGGVLHLRVAAELWEARPVWDRLVYPAIVRVFRFALGAGRMLSITDPSGVVITTQEAPRAVPFDVALGEPSRVDAAAKYYVHVTATIGTLAEREADEVGDAVFGRADGGSLAAFGRTMFRAMLQLSDYLQSVSAEARSRKLAGADIIRP
jgi:hypothetical protein